MSVTITKEAKEIMLRSLQQEMDSKNPFYRDEKDGKNYCRYDKISIENTESPDYGLKISFWYKGQRITEQLIFTNDVKIGGKDDSLVSSINITGIEGRMEVLM